MFSRQDSVFVNQPEHNSNSNRLLVQDTERRADVDDKQRRVKELLEATGADALLPVPEGELVWVMTGDSASVLDATETATRDALSQLGGHDPLGVVAFDCVARRGILGDDRLPNEISRVRDAIGSDAPVSGFYTYGEIARQGGSLGFHHQTMVVLGLA